MEAQPVNTKESKMDKKDPSETSKKFDLGGMVKSIKSIISPEIPTPAEAKDAVGVKIGELRALIHQVVTTQEALTNDIGKINILITSLEKDVEVLRGAQSGRVEEVVTVTTETKKPDEK